MQLQDTTPHLASHPCTAAKTAAKRSEPTLTEASKRQNEPAAMAARGKIDAETVRLKRSSCVESKRQVLMY